MTMHFGHHALVETRPIELVRIPVKGNGLHESVLFHPRYSPPKSVWHERIFVRGYRRGRGIDILLDEPITIDGRQYAILNFKGVGADADKEMIVHPTLWYDHEKKDGTWVSRKKGDIVGRMWGALMKTDGEIEMKRAAIVQQFGIPIVPHVALNAVPYEVCGHIANVEHRTRIATLSQLVRALHTNIRLAETLEHCQSSYGHLIDSRMFGEIDSVFVRTQLQLAKEGKTLVFMGRVVDNRMVNGEYIDAENLVVGPLGECKTNDPMATLIKHMAEYVLDKQKYLSALEMGTGIKFTAMLSPIAEVMQPFHSFYSLLNEAIGKAAENAN